MAKKNETPDGMVTITITEDAAADMVKIFENEIKEANHKIELHNTRLYEQTERLRAALENLRAVDGQHSLFSVEQ